MADPQVVDAVFDRMCDIGYGQSTDIRNLVEFTGYDYEDVLTAVLRLRRDDRLDVWQQLNTGEYRVLLLG